MHATRVRVGFVTFSECSLALVLREGGFLTGTA